jgi:hypothetical protein
MDNVKICNLFIKLLRYIKNVEDDINKRNNNNIQFNYDLIELLKKIYVNILNYFLELDICNLSFNVLVSEYILSKDEKDINFTNISKNNCIPSNNVHIVYISNNKLRITNIVNIFIDKNNIDNMPMYSE